jgi:hypothetical protein
MSCKLFCFLIYSGKVELQFGISVKVPTQRLSTCQYFVLPPFSARQAFSLRRIDVYNARMANWGNFPHSSKTASSKFLAVISVLACNCFATMPQTLNLGFCSPAYCYVDRLHLPGGGVRLGDKEVGRDGGERHDLATTILRVGAAGKPHTEGFD